jgi:hypothetical protein
MTIAKGNDTYIQNPKYNDKNIFLMHDTVHILKCVWRNWINQKDDEQTLTYPSAKGLLSNTEDAQDNQPVTAYFSHIRQIYFAEQKDLVKVAPTLNYKAIYPSSFDRQNVRLALSIFSEYNLAALRINEKYDTADFIEIILHWWHIVNVKSKFVGKRKRNQFSEPIRSADDYLVHYLEKFDQWLEHLNKLPGVKGKLTKETYAALLHTVRAILDLIRYVFSTTDVEYILLGKLQNDNLEARFGEYRQLCGANYLVSVQQILEAEKKLRIHSLLSMRSSRYGDIPIRDLSDTLSHSNSSENSACSGSDTIEADVKSMFVDLDPNECDMFVTAGTEKALTDIAGFVSCKTIRKLSCLDCKDRLQLDKTMTAESDDSTISMEYIKLLDRGG